jgi:hypothetical protein
LCRGKCWRTPGEGLPYKYVEKKTRTLSSNGAPSKRTQGWVQSGKQNVTYLCWRSSWRSRSLYELVSVEERGAAKGLEVFGSFGDGGEERNDSIHASQAEGFVHHAGSPGHAQFPSHLFQFGVAHHVPTPLLSREGRCQQGRRLMYSLKFLHLHLPWWEGKPKRATGHRVAQG